ncbi:extracellular metalloprotease [Rhizoctonia solani]|uniref:Extracellular metalloprotease n=1 Tax=Rhizoctonia solani TaxID=456999 RepID=A0A8H8P2N8_9AGAM|nr:extracellular metalloprotease [Rhizoctonia solani]QRW22836.1 extracellular metalloprotease [Rhizoctonia solani]
MVALSRFFIAALALATSSLALPSNATLSARDLDDLDSPCATDDPYVGLSEAEIAGITANPPLNIPETRTIKVDSAILALNSQFVGSGFTFQRAQLKYTKNAKWFNEVDKNQLTLDMKNKLHTGTAKDLNIYTLHEFEARWIRYLPMEVYQRAQARWCCHEVEHYPWGSLSNYNQGKILTHEVGHWAGLFHTFQGGCSEKGDEVSDTPAEETAATGCPVSRDTCKDIPGQDPIHNYMDYTYDRCKTDPFTAGQIKRMREMMQQHRAK